MTAPAPSRLADNVVHFARVLRRAGLPVGPGKVLAAIEALTWVGLDRRDDFHTALAATLLDRADQRDVFDQAFALFWREPAPGQRSKRPRLPEAIGRLGRSANAQVGSRIAQALDPRNVPAHGSAGGQPLELDAAMTFSPREMLQAKDFESMSIEELAAARRMLRTLRLPLPYVTTRRHAAHPNGRSLDLRATLRHSLRYGGEWVVPRKRERRRRPSVLIALCDVSGSMARYSRMLLHFLHALTAARTRVHTFTFATRLTNITRSLRCRDVDRAMTEVGHGVPDWSGGTRIGACLHDFNLHWSRRLLAQGAVVLIVSDGLDRGDGAELGAQMARLRASCRQIVWLNPLLRFEGFEPRAAGIRSMLPHVDHFLPAHNITSLTDLGRVFSALPARGSPRHRSGERTNGNDRRTTDPGTPGDDLAGVERPRGAESLHPGLRVDRRKR